MQRSSSSEKFLLQELMLASSNVKAAVKNLSIGALIKSIRTQLGMSQSVLAKLARMPQATVSRIEQGRSTASITTLKKILGALSCDLIIVPLLHESIETIRRKQARKIAEKHVKYLKGTMNLENQQPDAKFVEELIKQEEQRLLQGSNAKLWEENE